MSAKSRGNSLPLFKRQRNVYFDKVIIFIFIFLPEIAPVLKLHPRKPSQAVVGTLVKLGEKTILQYLHRIYPSVRIPQVWPNHPLTGIFDEHIAQGNESVLSKLILSKCLYSLIHYYKLFIDCVDIADNHIH